VLQHAVDEPSPTLLNSRSAPLDGRADRRGIPGHLGDHQDEVGLQRSVTPSGRDRYRETPRSVRPLRMSKLPASRRFHVNIVIDRHRGPPPGENDIIALRSMIHAGSAWAEEIPASCLWALFPGSGNDNGLAGGPGGRGSTGPGY
jgi:hypothetical protein